MKRIVLFIATNLAVVLVLSVVLRLLGLDRAMYSQTGMSTEGLLVLRSSRSSYRSKWQSGQRVRT